MEITFSEANSMLQHDRFITNRSTKRIMNKKIFANKRHTIISVQTQKWPDTLQLSRVLQKNYGSKRITSNQADIACRCKKGQYGLEWVQ